ncbi:ATP-dependent DNA helicase [Salinirussus salinus]|uniref:ATP-dependent DNA helicase n=1 Tax=Salinirussus salinus TaxID=1198300 RepID=UPI00135751CD|nr:ATP-dependent DNA helicase [Salinirussus salinus]
MGDGADTDGADAGGAGSDGAGSPDWREYFGFPEPYENQADAVESAMQAGRARGYLAMEGPCGTGKTMAALTAGAALVRGGDYERVLVVTPVKQQRRQFVEDLRTMNAGLEEPLRGVSLTGKRDLCPYGREEVFGDTSTHDRCEDLRENTAGLVESEGTSDDRPAAEAAVPGAAEDVWWDPQRGADLAAAARPDAAGQRTLAEESLSTAGATSPYRHSQPAAPADMSDGEDDGPLYCPFEADWYARNRGSPVGFAVGEHGVVTPEEYLPAATERGTCPHRVMSVLLEAAEVVVGNYNHLFDPDSRPLLASILDEDTFVVVDEAHRLEERVRDLLSDRLGRATLVRARNDCASLLTRAREGEDRRSQIADRLASHEVSLDAVERARDFYDDVIGWLDDRVAAYLVEEHGPEWRADPRTLPERDREVPLRDPETVERDELTEWAEREGYTGADWRTLPAVGAAVEETLSELGERSAVAAGVGVLLRRWYEADHAASFRELELEHAPADERAVGEPWQAAYTAGLVRFECMPGESLRDIFDELGGGVLMSATLAPLSVFTEVSGLEALRREGRPVIERSYGLPFPEENRASWLVDAEPFTAHNRGDPAEQADPDGWNRTRDEYAHALRTLARSPGNVMLALPNYREARWAGDYLREAVDKPVLVDESSSNEATERLKRDFFAGEGKVLVTSTRGTLTEGVDYDGDKLGLCAVVGVPLVNIGSPRVRAVRRAYADAFGEDRAFEYALTVPAVRRARQAIGRVIRGTEERGVRALVGRRYVPGARHSVFEYLSPAERAEFVRMTPDFLADKLRTFWASDG